jgi:hypothetical protein
MVFCPPGKNNFFRVLQRVLRYYGGNTVPGTAKGVGLNPMELNDLYDHLWNLGTLLQG